MNSLFLYYDQNTTFFLEYLLQYNHTNLIDSSRDCFVLGGQVHHVVHPQQNYKLGL